MSAVGGGALLIGLGLLLAALATFGWSWLSRMPAHRVRVKVYGSGTARTMTIGGGLACAAAGGLLLVAG